MAISKIFQLDHLPKGYTTNDGINGFANSGIPVNRWTTMNSAYSVISSHIQGNKLCFSHVAGETRPMTGVWALGWNYLTPGITASVNKVTIGFRATVTKLPNAGWPYIFTLTYAVGANDTATQYLFALNEIGMVVGATKYCEVEINFAARTLTLTMDGVFVRSVALNAYITWNTWYWCVGHNSSSGFENGTVLADPTPLFNFSDIYVTVDTGAVDDQYRGRLGPIQVRRLPVVSSNGAPWETSDGVPLVTALNTPRDGAANATPFIRNDIAKTPLALKLDTSAIKEGETVIAMGVNSTPFRDSAVGAVLNTSVKYGTSSTPFFPVTPNVLVPGPDTVMGYVAALPGGGALTKAALANVEIVFTPV